MNTLKLSFIMIIAFLSQTALAQDWAHKNIKVQEADVRISYTTSYLPATYGSQGGAVAGLFYVDIYSSSDLHVSDGMIFEITSEGRLREVSTIKVIEDHSKHYYAKKNKEHSYGDFIWFKKDYVLKLTINGRLVEVRFKL